MAREPRRRDRAAARARATCSPRPPSPTTQSNVDPAARASGSCASSARSGSRPSSPGSSFKAVRRRLGPRSRPRSDAHGRVRSARGRRGGLQEAALLEHRRSRRDGPALGARCSPATPTSPGWARPSSRADFEGLCAQFGFGEPTGVRDALWDEDGTGRSGLMRGPRRARACRRTAPSSRRRSAAWRQRPRGGRGHAHCSSRAACCRSPGARSASCAWSSASASARSRAARACRSDRAEGARLRARGHARSRRRIRAGPRTTRSARLELGFLSPSRPAAPTFRTTKDARGPRPGAQARLGRRLDARGERRSSCSSSSSTTRA